MTLQTLGSSTAPERYSRITLKERILREVVRRIESKDYRFATVEFKRVVRHPLPDTVSAKSGAWLSVVDTEETFTVTAQMTQVSTEVQFEFAVVPGQGEVASTVLNLIAGELIETLAGNNTLKEGETGEDLSCAFHPVSYTPDLEDASKANAVVTGLLTFNLIYRHRSNRPFDPR